MRAREIWPRIVEIINFWKVLPISKKLGKRKMRADTSYDHLCSNSEGPASPPKVAGFF